MRKALFAAAVGVLAWAAVAVPLPVLALSPVQAQPVTSIIELAERPDRLTGEILFTGVRAEPATAAGVIATWVDEHRRIAIRPLLGPSGGDGQDVGELQRRIFRESVDVAAAAAMREAGMDVQVSGGGAEVVRVAPGTPAEGQLQEGDVIVAAGGQRIRLATELASITSGMRPGETIELTVERGSGTRTVTLQVATLSQTSEAGIGVAVRSVDLRIRLPVEVRIPGDVRVGGASAGLMMALTIYDLLEDTDLTGGATIAGTGAIDLAGRVHPVAGIAEKVRGAELAGAGVFVVAAPQADAARAAAPADMRVLAVEDLSDAIERLRERDG